MWICGGKGTMNFDAVAKQQWNKARDSAVLSNAVRKQVAQPRILDCIMRSDTRGVAAAVDDGADVNGIYRELVSIQSLADVYLSVTSGAKLPVL